MKVCCPECGYVAPATAFAGEADARAALAIAARLPGPLGEPVLRYIALFRPRGRALAWSRAKKLIHELAADIERGTIRRHGRDWAAPHAAWQAALETVIAQREALTLPLKDHGYLYEIICRGANRSEAAAENQREAQRRTRQPAEQRPPHGSIAAPEQADKLRAALKQGTAATQSPAQQKE